MASLGDLLLRVGIDVSDFQSGLDAVNRQLGEAGKQAESSLSGFEKLGDSLTSVGSRLTAAITLPIVGLGTAAIVSAGQMEQTQIAFTTLLHSGEQATQMLSELRQFAASTPFEFSDLTNAAQKMLALGFSAKDVIPVLTTVGDAASGLGKGTEGMNAIILALGQMSLAGKVSAQDMMQLTSQGVAGWRYLAEAAGVSVAEVRALSEKGALDASQAVQVILAGMRRDFGGSMADMSNTLLAQFDNAKEKVVIALGQIGNTLLPVAKNVLSSLDPVLNAIKGMAEWFAKLPAPIQNTILVVAALAAVIGPLLVVAGTLITSFTAISAALPVIGTAFAALSGPIGVAILALTALGLWIASNWEPIKATVSQAWDGVSEFWSAAWNSVIFPILKGTWDAFSAIAQVLWGTLAAIIGAVWNPISTIFSNVWAGISGVLTGLWNGIASVAQSVWGTIVGVINEFISAAMKIPGMAKLMDLASVWNSGKVAAEASAKAHDAAAQSIDKVKNTSSQTAPTLELLAGNNDKAAKAAQKHAEELVKLRTEALHNTDEWQILEVQIDKVGKKHEDLIKSVANLRERVSDGSISVLDLSASATILSAKLTNVKTSADELKNIKTPIDQMKASIDDAVTSVQKLDSQYKTLGITSSAEMQAQAQRAQEAYQAITTSGTASAGDILRAHKAAVDAQIAAYEAAGQKIPADMKSMSDTLDKQVEQSCTNQKSSWTTMSDSINRSITDLSTSMVQSLFEGDGSFADKGLRALQGIGEAVATSFITPATKAVSDFISGAITDLLSGKGLGGVMDSLKKIGDSFSSIFGGASSAAGGAAGAAGGAGGAAGSAVGAIGSFIGTWGGVIGGAMSAIGSIAGAAMMGGDLGNIEENTRYTFNQLVSLQDGANKYWPGITTTTQLLSQIIDYYLGRLWQIGDRMVDLVSIQANSYNRLGDVETSINSLASRERPNVTVTVTAETNADPAAIADMVASVLADQYALAS